MLTPEEVIIRDLIMHPSDGILLYEYESVKVGDTYIDFFVTEQYIYQRIYNHDRSDFSECLIIKVV